MMRKLCKYEPIFFVVVVVIIFAIYSFFIFNRAQIKTLQGCWKDINKDYYVYFKNDGTYIETTYSIPREFVFQNGELVMYGITGRPEYSVVKPNQKREIHMNVNGFKHIMRECKEDAKLYAWGNPTVGLLTDAFSLKNPIDITSDLKFYDDMSFTLSNDTEMMQGKYALDGPGYAILFTDNGDTVQAVRRWWDGVAFGKMTGDIVKAGVGKGILIEGIVRDESIGTIYKFTGDNQVERLQSSGESTEFFYFIDEVGLITMTDTLGNGTMDYLWYDVSDSAVYRYVYCTNAWYEFLGENE